MIRTWLQGTVGLLVTAAVLVVCFAFFAVRIATRSHPEPYVTSTVKVADTTRIYRNTFGIPHIIARSTEDAVFAQGYVHAQDRLWQMDMFRRIGRGTVAEVLGSRAVDVDVFMRALQLTDIARRQWRSCGTETHRLLEAYARGVNAYIDEFRGRYPFEFDALEYEPAPWTAEDCLIVGRVIAFELSFGFFSDIAHAQIAAQRTLPVARMYIPQGRSGEPVVLDSVPWRGSTGTATVTDSTLTSAQRTITNSLAQRLRTVRSVLGIEASGVGSNAWAVSKGAQGALLANDPHMSISLPAKFYQIHLTAPGLNVLGMSVPGLPLVISGRNDRVAWGISNVMLDDVDFFLERVDDKNNNYYYDDDGMRRKFRFRRDTIRIKDQPDSLIDLRATRRSTVISDVHLLRHPQSIYNVPRDRATTLLMSSCITFRWTANTVADEILTLRRLATARSVSDVRTAVTTWHAPAFNLTFATIDGHVGTVPMGIAPIRGKGDPHYLNPGWDKASDWQGTVPLATLGMLVDPPGGRVAAANNRTSSRPAPFVGTLFEPSSRAERILDQLRIYDEYSVRDAQVMQQDVVSPYARAVVGSMMPVLRKGMARYGAVEKQALSMLARWDGSFSTLDSAATVYAAFQQRMIVNTFEDELGQQLFMDWCFVGNQPVRRIAELIHEPQHPLFDDARTPQREDLSWIAIRSFIEAVQEVRQRVQTDQPSQWRWGSMHTITFGHRFGEHPLMRPVMDQGPFDMPGSGTTLNNGEWAVYHPYTTRVAAAMRVISDLRDSLQYSVVPGGVSGQPLDPHYADQVQLWLKGGYVRLPVAPEPDVTFQQFLLFVPE